MAGKSNTPIILTEQEVEFINGCLLGDGHITKPKGKSCQFSYTTSKKGHADYVYQNLKRMAVNECKDGPTRRESYDRRTKKTYVSYVFRTVSNLIFYELRNKWYPDGIKIVPTWLKITPLVALMWYVGDGSLNNQCRTSLVKLSTNGFTKQDVENVLLPQMNHWEATVYSTGKDQWSVFIPKIRIRSFLDFIGPCPVSDYSYKWDLPEYKRKCYEDGTVTDFAKIKNEVLTDYLKGDTMWSIHKKYGVDYNLVKYHLRNYDRCSGKSHEGTV